MQNINNTADLISILLSLTIFFNFVNIKFGVKILLCYMSLLELLHQFDITLEVILRLLPILIFILLLKLSFLAQFLFFSFSFINKLDLFRPGHEILFLPLQ